MKAREECAEQLWKCGYVLWRIADSQILSDHLTVFGMLWFRMPPKHSKAFYVNQLEFSAGLTGAWNKDRGDGEDGEVQDKDTDMGGRGHGQRVQVSHWMALDVLSSFSQGTAAQNVKIHLLSAKHLRHTNSPNEIEF